MSASESHSERLSRESMFCPQQATEWLQTVCTYVCVASLLACLLVCLILFELGPIETTFNNYAENELRTKK